MVLPVPQHLFIVPHYIHIGDVISLCLCLICGGATCGAVWPCYVLGLLMPLCCQYGLLHSMTPSLTMFFEVVVKTYNLAV